MLTSIYNAVEDILELVFVGLFALDECNLIPIDESGTPVSDNVDASHILSVFLYGAQ
jgi:hypothetical protein